MGQTDIKPILKNILKTIAGFGIAPPGTAHIFDAGTGGYLKYFEKEIIDELIAYEGATCRFFEGVYGSGKSHLLQLLKELAFRKGMVVASTDLSQALGLTDWKLITQHILENMEIRIDGEIIRSLPKILSVARTKSL